MNYFTNIAKEIIYVIILKKEYIDQIIVSTNWLSAYDLIYE